MDYFLAATIGGVIGVVVPVVIVKGFEMYQVWKEKRKIWRSSYE